MALVWRRVCGVVGFAVSDGTGWAARRGARWAGPFPCGLPPNRTGPFPSIRLSGDHAVAAVGEWMASWQGWQTTRVLRRFLAMSTAHSG